MQGTDDWRKAYKGKLDFGRKGEAYNEGTKKEPPEEGGHDDEALTELVRRNYYNVINKLIH